MSLSTCINSLGLLLDIAGVVLIWRFGLPPEVSRSGMTLLAIEGNDPKEIAKGKRFDFYSRLGLGILIAGFVLQLVSNFTK